VFIESDRFRKSKNINSNPGVADSMYENDFMQYQNLCRDRTVQSLHPDSFRNSATPKSSLRLFVFYLKIYFLVILEEKIIISAKIVSAKNRPQSNTKMGVRSFHSCKFYPIGRVIVNNADCPKLVVASNAESCYCRLSILLLNRMGR
jgi:hypothetical protein